MNSASYDFGSDSPAWSVIDDPTVAGFSVHGVPDGWARADHLLIDGLPAAVWFPPPPHAEGFTPNAVLAAWTAYVTRDRLDDSLRALRTPEGTDGPILMEPPVVLANTMDAFSQRADAVIQSPFGPLSSRVWHVIRRSHADQLSMGRLTVTVKRQEAHLLGGVELRPRS